MADAVTKDAVTKDAVTKDARGELPVSISPGRNLRFELNFDLTLITTNIDRTRLVLIWRW